MLANMPESARIYYLNLDRHPDRRANMDKQFSNLGLDAERVAAIDAETASEAELNNYVDAAGPIPRMGAGARACTVGHFLIWEKFLKTDAKVAFILEDDAKVSSAFAEFVDEAVKISDEVEILNFNRQNSKGDTKKLVVAKAGVLQTPVFDAMRLLGPHYGTAGYMITRATAQRLVHQIKRTNIPIDHLLFNPNVSNFNRSSRIYQSFPAMVEPDIARFATSIQSEAVPNSVHWRKKLSRAYYETNRIPFLLLQMALNRAAVRNLYFQS